MSLSERRAMIDKEYSGLSIVRQCELLKVSRSFVYYILWAELDQTRTDLQDGSNSDTIPINHTI